jgi:hypothetical protein
MPSLPKALPSLLEARPSLLKALPSLLKAGIRGSAGILQAVYGYTVVTQNSTTVTISCTKVTWNSTIVTLNCTIVTIHSTIVPQRLRTHLLTTNMDPSTFFRACVNNGEDISKESFNPSTQIHTRRHSLTHVDTHFTHILKQFTTTSLKNSS